LRQQGAALGDLRETLLGRALQLGAGQLRGLIGHGSLGQTKSGILSRQQARHRYGKSDFRAAVSRRISGHI
jgi:hypothetical protein